MMVASAVFRCGLEGCNKTFKTRGALATHQGHHKRKRSREELDTNPPDATGSKSCKADVLGANYTAVEAAAAGADGAAAPKSPLMQHPAGLVDTHAIQALATIQHQGEAGFHGNSVASYAAGIGQLGQTTPVSPLLGPPLTPTSTVCAPGVVLGAWTSETGGQHQYGVGQWAGDNEGAPPSNCDEVEVCLPCSPLVAPPPHVSVPSTESDGALYPSCGVVL